MIYREDYDNAQDYLDALIRSRRLKIRLVIALIMLVIAGIIGGVLSYYKVRNVQVTGNTRYTNDEIAEMVTGGFLSDNSLLLSFRYRNKKITNVPFIEQMDVTVITHDTIKITVYEKSLAGYVSYLGSNFYFGRDGTVVESSKEIVDGVPQILGLEFDHIALYEQLPVHDVDIFGRILNVTQLLTKYELSADSIYFDSSGNMTIYFGDVRVAMGGDDYTDEKLSNVSKILPSLTGSGAGTLKMSSYTPSTKYVTFVVKDGKATDITSAIQGMSTADAAGGSADSSGAVGVAGTAGGSTTDAPAGSAMSGSSGDAAGTVSGVATDAAGSAGNSGVTTTTGWEAIPEEDGGVTDTIVNGTETSDTTDPGTADSGTSTGDGTVEETSAEPVIPTEAVEVTE